MFCGHPNLFKNAYFTFQKIRIVITVIVDPNCMHVTIFIVSLTKKVFIKLLLKVTFYKLLISSEKLHLKRTLQNRKYYIFKEFTFHKFWKLNVFHSTTSENRFVWTWHYTPVKFWKWFCSIIMQFKFTTFAGQLQKQKYEFIIT